MSSETKPGEVLGYARTSRADQVIDYQIDALTKAGCTRIFEDPGVSGAKANRPGLDALLDYARPGDVIVIHALSRLGRTTKHLIPLVEGLYERGIPIRSLSEGIDMATPAGRLIVTILAALSQMERELLIERTHAGLDAARARGRIGGRKPVLTDGKFKTARRLVAAGTSVAEAAEVVGVSRSTLYRALSTSAIDESAEGGSDG